MTKTLEQKLLDVQKNLGAVTKDKDNPFFKSKYADINTYIDAIKPELTKHNIVILQPLTLEGLKTILIDTENLTQMEFETRIPVNADPQKMGSAITYFRRYALQSLFVMKADDDDANSASQKSDKEPF